MGCLKFNKEELVNLEYALKREVLLTNRAGGYCSTTIVCCNTRKYHGLLVLPVASLGEENHVLLSSLSETIVQHEKSFNLGIHKYPGTYYPRGHKYIVDFSYEPVFSLVYRVGGVMLKKELVMVHNKAQVMIRYTLLDAHSDTLLRLKPFLAYRRIHDLSKANRMANTRHETVDHGIRSCLYSAFPPLNMQVSDKHLFVAAPDWYYNVEYNEERLRGYEFQEDLFVPGYFEISLRKGESVVFSASTAEEGPSRLRQAFEEAIKERGPRDHFEHCLKYSAAQFIVRTGKETEVVAGYPWFGRWGRDTFIALPGITLAAAGDVKGCKEVLDTMVRQLQNGLFPNIGKPPYAAYNSVDAPLWFFWTLQQYGAAAGEGAIWKQYGGKMKAILSAYREGINPGIRMTENGLVWASLPGRALTWMDAVVDGKAVTLRPGYAVEINALWYNAVCYALRLAGGAGDRRFGQAWEALPEKIRESYNALFWDPEKGYLADHADETGRDFSVRPNQLFACSLEYSPLSDEMKWGVLDVIRRELLSSRGLRTLSPKNPDYKGTYEGNQAERDRAYHQGTAWPWLIGAYIEANLKLRGKQFLPVAKELLAGFEEDISLYGICSIAEVYDGNPPQRPNGCIAQAWSVGEVLRSMALIKAYEEMG
ncbi:MAG: amylo-alpha-1,6-glucosidase [Odoribacteraceae bacterium]|jgi:predicted glycogen debranching enzyme|nr:amylo-alpha-1,6-glucosidase [Odoribacteraceae bacterium]